MRTIISPNMFTDQQKHRGFLGEAVVAFMLQNRGWTLLQRNWRDKQAEIDLIMQDVHGDIHCIEVKTRSKKDSRHGHLLEMISQKQVLRIRRAFPRMLRSLSVDIRNSFCHIDGAFVLLQGPKAFVSFFPDCDV